MAADLFESYSVMLVASLILGKSVFGDKGLVFPLLVPIIGVIIAVIGIVLASAIQLLTGRFKEITRRPVRVIGQGSETGAARHQA
jgi:Na+/H+-translocating membrane pyrophosphatase